MKSLSRPKDLVKRSKELGLKACAITDYDSVAGCIEFLEEAEKEGVKPILGCKIGISHLDANIKEKHNEKVRYITLLCQNTEGWKNLIRIISRSNDPENFYGRPRLSLNQLGELDTKGLICLSGELFLDKIITDVDQTYKLEAYDEIKSLANKDWIIECSILADVCREIFGKESFYLDVDQTDNNNYVAAMLASAHEYLGHKNKIKLVNGADYRYPNSSEIDRFDFQTILTSGMKTIFPNRVAVAQKNFPHLSHFFRSLNHHVPTFEELARRNKESQIKNGNDLSDRIEKYNIFNPPTLPPFPCPSGYTQESYLQELSREGWKRKLSHIIDSVKKKEYGDRFKKEFKVISEVELSSYFLIIQDIVNQAKKDQQLVGPGRGSSAGCLLSYLLNITEIDPILYDLSFERFYNAGRNSPGKVSWPDIDIDFPIKYRDKIVEYMRDKYGRDRVAQIMTFVRIQGRGAVKEVLRVHNCAGHDLMNRMTKPIPDEAAIADQLQAMKEEEGESSIVRWALENNADELSDWCKLKDDGTCEGDYAKQFEQAIRLEGIKKAYGRHPAGIIIAPDKLENLCPMIYDKNSESKIIGFDMRGVEQIGLVKLDALGINTLDKIMGVVNEL